MKKIPYFIQGFLFAPSLIGLVFILKITCPVHIGSGCFADNFLIPTFMPLSFLYKAMAPYAPLVAKHEPLFLLGYWSVVGFLAGLCVDLALLLWGSVGKEDNDKLDFNN